MARVEIVSLELLLGHAGLIDRLTLQKTRLNDPVFDLPVQTARSGRPVVGQASAECSPGTPRKGFSPKRWEPCGSCLDRDAIDIAGNPRPEARRLGKCEECSGTGHVAILLNSRGDDTPREVWNQANDPYSKDVSARVAWVRARQESSKTPEGWGG